MGKYDALFEAEPQVQSKYDALFEEEPTPTPAPATIRSEGQGPEPREDGFLGKIRALLSPTPTPGGGEPLPEVPGEENVVDPEWLAKPARAVGKYVSEMIPRTPEAWTRAAGIPTDWSDPRQVAGLAFPMVRGMGGIDLPEHVQQRAEAVQAAEETPPWSQERWTAGVAPVLDIAQIAAGAPLEAALPAKMAAQRAARLRATIEKPTLPEPIGPGTAADAVTHAVDELRYNEDVAPKLNLELAREEPTAPSVAQATEPAPTVREAISLDELRLIRERGELEAQPRDATGRSHPAVEERLAQIDQELTSIANRELQETQLPTRGEPSASQITEPTSVGVQPKGEGMGRTPPLRQPRETTPVLKLEEEAVPGSGGAQETEAAVAPGVAAEAPISPPEDLPYTGVSKAAIAEQRGARGVPDIERQKQIDFGESVAQAKATLAKNPLAGKQLIDNFMERSRPIAAEETPLAIEQMQQVQREFDAATEAVNKATPEELPYAQDRLNNARTQYDLTTEAVQNATSATGAGLNSVKMLLKDDFSLARMEQVARAVINDGKPLSPKQAGDVAKLHKRLQIAETKIAGYEAADAFRAALKEAKAQEKAGFRVTDFMDRQAQAARERIVARRGKLYADPLGVTNVAHLADEAIIGASHITRGVTRFADWSSAMLREFGENIKPYLRGLYAKAKELAGNTAKGKLTPEEREARALGGEKKRIRTLTQKMRERLVKRDVSPLREKREPRMDEEKVALLYEREKVKKEYREMLAVEALKRAPWYKKAGRLASEPLRAVRSLKFSFDASALMQQGGFETFGHPIAQAKRVMPMLRAMRSEAGQFKVMNEIQNLPEWKSGEFRQAGVEFGEIDTPFITKREEIFASRLAQKVPGVKMSERGFVTLLNQIRAERYVALKNDLFGGGLFRKGGELTLNEKKILGNFVNVSTGRGNLGPFKQATMLLNAIFAAPRLRVSNFQLMLGQPIWHKLGSGSGRVRALMLKEYAKTLGGISAAVAAASQIPGVDVELDSRSTDFGQIRMGNLRINPFSRLTSPAVLTRRLTSGQTKTQKGEIKPIYGGEVPYGGTTGIDVAGRYLRGGLTPVIGGIVSGMTGEMVTGEPTTPLKELTSAPVPLSANNLSDALKAENVPTKIIAGILSATGIGVGYYGPRSGAAKKAEAARLKERDKALLHGDVRQAYDLSFRPPGEETEGVAGDVSGDLSRRMRMRAVRPSVR